MTLKTSRPLIPTDWPKRGEGKAAESMKTIGCRVPVRPENAKAAAAILVAKKAGFIIPTGRQRQNLLVAFAKRGKVVYGKAFDVVKLSGLWIWTTWPKSKSTGASNCFEIKSSRKKLRSDFSGYFFALTAAEVLVAQSLKKQFGFVLVTPEPASIWEMSLSEISPGQGDLPNLEHFLLNPYN